MSRRNRNTPKFGKPSPELLNSAKKLVKVWREALNPYRSENCYYAGIDNNDPVPKDSLTNAMCAWIERNEEDWEVKWKSVLDRFPTSAFLQKGYKGFLPNLFWMFKVDKRSGQSGLDRVLAGCYDEYTLEYRGGIMWSPDEGV